MRQDERHDLPGFPRIVRGTSLPHEVSRDASTISLWLGSTLVGAFRRLFVLVRVLWPYLVRVRQYLVWALWLLGLLCQVVLLWLLGEMVDLFLSAVELWLEMVTKHLEIVLDET